MITFCMNEKNGALALDLKDRVQPKKNCHYLLTLMSLQTLMTFHSSSEYKLRSFC